MSEQNIISRVPPEIWERITNFVSSSKDLINIIKAIPFCKKLLYPKRAEWLFYQVLPVLITNTYGKSEVPFQKDLLNCRLVCKHWKLGVDSFFKNNLVHYPASGDDVDWKLSRCHFGETFYLNSSNIFCRKFTNCKLKKMLEEALNHRDNPIVGGYVHLVVSETNHQESVSLIEQFVEKFGHYIYILRLQFVGETDPVKFIVMLLSLLKHLPNLKGMFVNRINWSSNYDANKCTINYFKQELTKVNTNTVFLENFRNGFPKLETLDLEIDGLIGDILKQVVINMFSLDSLKSLTLVDFVTSCKRVYEFPNLLHLCLHIDANEQLESALKIKCSNLRKLELELMYDEVDYDLLYKVLLKFQCSVSHLSLHLPDALETVNYVEKKKMINFFTTPNVLQLPCIKTVSLFGWRPPSLNFLCEDDFGRLEYLNLYLENGDEEDNPFLNHPLPNVKYTEIMDVTEKLTPMWPDCWSWKEPEMYKSNIWNVFPKLKGLFVARYDYWDPLRKNGWAYRRNNL